MAGAGPNLYENWKAKENGADTHGGFEFSIFSDGEVYWQAPAEIGPLKIFGTLVLEHNAPVPGTNLISLGPRAGATQAFAVRVTEYRAHWWDPASIDWSKTSDDSYHGGGEEDEIAALLSLLSGARLRAGSFTRSFVDDDPLGRPLAVDRAPLPELPAPGPLRRVLPRVLGRHGMTAELLAGYPTLSPDAAIALVRAARLYRDGIWIAESDPNSAWLMLVSAVEVAAIQARFADSSPEEVFRSLRSELSTAVQEKGGPVLHAQVATELAPLLGSTNRFIKFLREYLPGPPTQRPPTAFQLDWAPAKIKATLNRVYELRSRALHAGVPFPAPMCEPPRPTPDDGVLAERPIGDTANGTVVWREGD